MTKIRVFIFILTIAVVAIFGTIASYYARGYRFDNTGNLAPSGLMVVNSSPLGAQIYVNGELKSATNATIGLAPGVYDVSLKKEGFITWQKRIMIEKEVVTQIDAKLSPQPRLFHLLLSRELANQWFPQTAPRLPIPLQLMLKNLGSG